MCVCVRDGFNDETEREFEFEGRESHGFPLQQKKKERDDEATKERLSGDMR